LSTARDWCVRAWWRPTSRGGTLTLGRRPARCLGLRKRAFDSDPGQRTAHCWVYIEGGSGGTRRRSFFQSARGRAPRRLYFRMMAFRDRMVARTGRYVAPTTLSFRLIEALMLFPAALAGVALPPALPGFGQEGCLSAGARLFSELVGDCPPPRPWSGSDGRGC